ncbi:MAG: hypothetical protein ABIH69_05730 [bacterium]|nr:hypothetical protein [Candidatus Margulisiibacteriota bacterium]
MKKSLVALLIVGLLCLASWSMIDSYFFKLKGEIISISATAVQNSFSSSINYSMKIKIIDILPNKNALAADIGRAKSRFKGTIDVQTVRSINNFDVSRLKSGDIIIGDFEQMEVEMHPAGGYRITNSLNVEKKAGGFFIIDVLLAPFVFLKKLIFGG